MSKASPKLVASAVAVAVPATKYYFSVDCPLTTELIGELADGLRFHLDYGDDQQNAVTTNRAAYDGAWLSGKYAAHQLDFRALEASIAGVDVEVADAIDEELEDHPSFKAFSKHLAAPTTDVMTRGIVVQALRGAKLAARPDKGLPKALTWLGLDGMVLSGADLALVRRDGVAIFDARITIQDDNGYKIQGIFSGTVDFGEDAYAQFATQRLPKLHWDVRLTARFEASEVPPAYAASRYKTQAIGSWKYEDLTRNQFVAIGTLTLKDEPYYPAENIQFDVYSLDV